MSEPNGFHQLQNLFANANSLPQLPGASLRLIQILDDEDVSSTEVERVIMGDPALTVAVIRAASSVIYGGQDEGTTTVRGAINKLGHKSIQSVAVSLGVQSLLGATGSCTSFDRIRFARHSIFVGFLARYIYACRAHRAPFNSRWSRDEIFAAGVLHDMGVGLLARVDASAYERIFRVAKRCECGFQSAFKSIYGSPITELSAIACKTWKLPSLFQEIIANFEEPLDHSEKVSLSCVHYANELADENSHGLVPWHIELPVDEEILAEVGLPTADVPGIVMLISQHTAAYVPLSHAA